MSDRIAPTANDVLIVVDVQNDFCAGGSLAVPKGEEIVPIANRLARSFGAIVLTQDWHPPDHRSFASQHKGRKPFDQVEFAYGPQILWPDHCVQESAGAAFRTELDIPGASLVVRKGFRREIDSYSAFFENDRTTPTGLAGYLRERGLSRVFLAGLAFDFCVGYSALDAARHGFETFVIEDACRAIDVAGSAEAMRKSLAAAGVRVILASAVG
jgi:nicotinamidase/pyrazinamidase